MAIITGAIMGWTLRNVTMCIISFVRGEQGVACVYFLIFLLAVLVWKEGGAVTGRTSG
jgi:hypothetical protein